MRNSRTPAQRAAVSAATVAAALLLALPIIAAYLVFQRRFVESLATSGLKG